MPSNAMLSLSTKGLVSDMQGKLIRGFALFMSANASQSTLFEGSVKSFPAMIQQAGDNTSKLRDLVSAGLSNLYQAQFDQVTVTVTISDGSNDGSNRLNVTLDVIVVDNGISDSLGRVIQLTDNVVTAIITTNNG